MLREAWGTGWRAVSPPSRGVSLAAVGEHPGDPRLTAHIEAVATRREFETRQLVSALVGRCWPGRSDRNEPVAREWVRRWGPRGPVPKLLACACASGHCQLCN